jgi:hypothetical protein
MEPYLSFEIHRVGDGFSKYEFWDSSIFGYVDSETKVTQRLVSGTLIC